MVTFSGSVTSWKKIEEILNKRFELWNSAPVLGQKMPYLGSVLYQKVFTQMPLHSVLTPRGL